MKQLLPRVLLWVLLALTAGPLLWYGTRALVTDRFVIKGESMAPTLHTGQGVWVNKLLMGPRIYTKFDFDSPDLHCVRLPGLGKIRVGMTVVLDSVARRRYGRVIRWETGVTVGEFTHSNPAPGGRGARILSPERGF